MLNNIFKGVFDSSAQATVSLGDFVLCLSVSLAIGLVLAIAYSIRSNGSRGFVVTLALLPAVVCMVIMLVNGNVGTGVAVAGAFSLVRFRSVPGTASEIGAIFIAMAAGLAAGIGYLGFAVLFTVVLCVAELAYSLSGFGVSRSADCNKTMRITIPEELEYTGVFDDIFATYTKSSTLQEVKTTNMGSLFRLTYHVTLKNATLEKELLDALRCRNGNLEITIARQGTGQYEL